MRWTQFMRIPAVLAVLLFCAPSYGGLNPLNWECSQWFSTLVNPPGKRSVGTEEVIDQFLKDQGVDEANRSDFFEAFGTAPIEQGQGIEGRNQFRDAIRVRGMTENEEEIWHGHIEAQKRELMWFAANMLRDLDGDMERMPFQEFVISSARDSGRYTRFHKQGKTMVFSFSAMRPSVIGYGALRERWDSGDVIRPAGRIFKGPVRKYWSILNPVGDVRIKLREDVLPKAKKAVRAIFDRLAGVAEAQPEMQRSELLKIAEARLGNRYDEIKKLTEKQIKIVVDAMMLEKDNPDHLENIMSASTAREIRRARVNENWVFFGVAVTNPHRIGVEFSHKAESYLKDSQQVEGAADVTKSTAIFGYSGIHPDDVLVRIVSGVDQMSFKAAMLDSALDRLQDKIMQARKTASESESE